LNVATKWITVGAGCSLDYSSITIRGAETINLEATAVAVVNHVVSFGNGSPFTGAGISDSVSRHDNIVFAMHDSKTQAGIPRTRTERGSITTGTTPSVASRDLFTLGYEDPTTITDFIDSANGQMLTLVTLNANVTIDNAPNILLTGGADWNMPTGSTLTLRDVAGTWYEVGRMDPS